MAHDPVAAGVVAEGVGTDIPGGTKQKNVAIAGEAEHVGLPGPALIQMGLVVKAAEPDRVGSVFVFRACCVVPDDPHDLALKSHRSKRQVQVNDFRSGKTPKLPTEPPGSCLHPADAAPALLQAFANRRDPLAVLPDLFVEFPQAVLVVGQPVSLAVLESVAVFPVKVEVVVQLIELRD